MKFDRKENVLIEEDDRYQNIENYKQKKDFAHYNFEDTSVVESLILLSELKNRILFLENEVIHKTMSGYCFLD